MADVKVRLDLKDVVTNFDEVDTLVAVVGGAIKRIENDELRKYFEKLTGMRIQSDGTDYWIEYWNGSSWVQTGFLESL